MNRALGVSVVLALLLSLGSVAVASSASPDPIAAFVTVQDSSASDLDKIQNAAVTYVSIWYESLRMGQVLDAAALFADTQRGQKNWKHLAGRVSLQLASAKYYNQHLSDYVLTPSFESPLIKGSKAIITVLGLADAQFTGHLTRDRIGQDPFTFSLVKVGCRWRIDSLESWDIFLEMYPVGTDIFALASTFEERTRQFEAQDQALAKRLRELPELAQRFTSSRAVSRTSVLGSTPYDTVAATTHAPTYTEEGTKDTAASCQNYVSPAVIDLP